MIKAIVTDGGGVFVSSTDHHIASAITRILKVDGKDFLLGDMSLLAQYQTGRITTGQFVSGRLKRLGIAADRARKRLIVEAFSDAYKKHSKVRRAVLDYLLSFRGQYTVALFSNTIEPHVRHNRSRFLHRFDRLFLSNEIGLRKPAQASFRHVAKELGLRPYECVFIDDMGENVSAAKAVGFHALKYGSLPKLRRDMVRLLAKKHGINRLLNGGEKIEKYINQSSTRGPK
jgi:HAD superfamily hydrolase (TIGR01509 family)